MTNSGAYVLRLELLEATEVSVGAFGPIKFQPGWYLYTGSARRNLRQRVDRHLTGRAALRWHIDYLRTAPGVVARGAILFPKVGECPLNRALGRLADSAPIPGFGASDCRRGCPAHLWFSHTPVGLTAIAGLRRRSQCVGAC